LWSGSRFIVKLRFHVDCFGHALAFKFADYCDCAECVKIVTIAVTFSIVDCFINGLVDIVIIIELKTRLCGSTPPPPADIRLICNVNLVLSARISFSKFVRYQGASRLNIASISP
jgi:hypothetical protein